MNVSKRKAERIGQKERTRQNLLSAARALVEEGETLTIARAAERANLAEATAYRYYRNPRSLLRDALSIDWSGLNDVLAALSILPSAADRAQRAAEEMAQFVLARELTLAVLGHGVVQIDKLAIADEVLRVGLREFLFRVRAGGHRGAATRRGRSRMSR
jgi:AcrR family transcriptional regulator